ncbi:MAG: Do family serine endopeptidase [Rhizomicrobium sp.]|jgi:serine protease Do
MTRTKTISVFAAVLLAAVATDGVAAQPAVPQSMPQVQLTFAPVVKRVAPAVVNVYSQSVVQTPTNPLFADPLFQRFFGGSPEMQKRVQQSLGSGVIVRPDGVIVTNNHVIQGGQNIVVALSDRREFKARVLLADSHTDLAVLKIDARGEKLPTVEFGDSDKVSVGDIVLAIGDPFGVGQTVTMGIVSALARTQISASDYQFFIQTDAAINPGNSGGALITSDGKLIGINTAIYSRTGDYAGIGFATPANLVRRIVEGAFGGGVKLPWLGADGQAVTAEIAQTLGLPHPGGVLLKSIYPGSPAANAGLRIGEVVLQVDGADVDDMQGLNYRIATHKSGESLRLKVAQGTNVRDVSVIVALPPENPPKDVSLIGGRNPLTGAKVENLSPAVATDLQLSFNDKGVVVISVADNTYSSSYGLQPGDIVRSINGADIRDVAALKRALETANGHWDMVIERAGRRLSLSVSE